MNIQDTDLYATLSELTEEELNKTIVGYVVETKKLDEERKDYTASIRDTIKEIEENMKIALEVRKDKKREQELLNEEYNDK